MRLYYYPPPPAPRYRSARVEIYPLGIGTEGKTLPLGATTVVEKLRDSTWVVPASIIAERRADGRPVQETVPPGPNNPLGRFALRLGWTSYLIHGTNQPFGIGMRVSHGCLRMYPEDVARLFGEVTIGTPVRIVDQPYKAARHHGRIYLEAHAPLTDSAHHPPSDLTGAVAAVIAVAGGALDDAAWGRVERVALQHRGILMPITAPVAAAADSRPLVAQAVPQGNGAQGWDVQIGAYRQSAGSRRVGEKIRALHWHPRGGMPPGGALCRIYVGPFASRAQARARQRALWKITGIEGQIYPAAHYAGFQPCD